MVIKVCAKAENHEKISFLFYIFPYVFFGVKYVFIVKNGDFQVFFRGSSFFVFSHYFNLTFIVS